MRGRPKPIADVMSELLARRGYGQIQTNEELETAWQAAVGAMLAKQTRVGLIRRGVLEIVCGSSIMVQELTFQKSAVLSQLAEHCPDVKITDLKLRVGSLA